jgi:hypothetical protein
VCVCVCVCVCVNRMSWTIYVSSRALNWPPFWVHWYKQRFIYTYLSFIQTQLRLSIFSTTIVHLFILQKSDTKIDQEKVHKLLEEHQNQIRYLKNIHRAQRRRLRDELLFSDQRWVSFIYIYVSSVCGCVCVCLMNVRHTNRLKLAIQFSDRLDINRDRFDSNGGSRFEFQAIENSEMEGTYSYPFKFVFLDPFS